MSIWSGQITAPPGAFAVLPYGPEGMRGGGGPLPTGPPVRSQFGAGTALNFRFTDQTGGSAAVTASSIILAHYDKDGIRVDAEELFPKLPFFVFRDTDYERDASIQKYVTAPRAPIHVGMTIWHLNRYLRSQEGRRTWNNGQTAQQLWEHFSYFGCLAFPPNPTLVEYADVCDVTCNVGHRSMMYNIWGFRTNDQYAKMANFTGYNRSLMRLPTGTRLYLVLCYREFHPSQDVNPLKRGRDGRQIMESSMWARLGKPIEGRDEVKDGYWVITTHASISGVPFAADMFGSNALVMYVGRVVDNYNEKGTTEARLKEIDLMVRGITEAAHAMEILNTMPELMVDQCNRIV